MSTTRMEPGFIVIEGWDYCGKTSAAEKIVKAVSNGVYYHSPRGLDLFPSQMYQLIKNMMSDIDQDTMRALQLAMNVFNLQKIWEQIEDGKFVVADRGILSTVAYQKMDTAQLVQAIKAFAPDPVVQAKVLGGYRSTNTFHLNPVCCYLLTNSLDVLKKRHQNRQQLDAWDDYALGNIEQLMQSYDESFEDVYPLARHLRIDTDNRSMNQVLQIIKDDLRIL